MTTRVFELNVLYVSVIEALPRSIHAQNETAGCVSPTLAGGSLDTLSGR